MRKIIFNLLFTATALACVPDEKNPVSDPNIEINTDGETLNKRITLEGSGVIEIFGADMLNGRISEEDIPAGKVPIVMVSQVNPPVIGDRELTATHVDIFGNYAYVSYNTAGPVFLGAIEIFDISDPLHPKIVSQAIFKNGDINSLSYKNGVLYAAAAFDIDQEPKINTAAQLVMVNVSNGKFISEFSKFDIEGFATVDVCTTSEDIAVASGSNGLVGLFNPKGEMHNKFPMTDLRAVKYGNEVLAALSGTEGIKLLKPSNLETILTIQNEKDIAESKRTLDMAPGLLLVSEGRNGAGIYSIPSGVLLQRLPILIKPLGVEEGDVVTNAVSYDDGKVYMANGGAGVSVSQILENDILEEIGVLGISGSSNFIKAYKDYIFVASGRKGLQILNLYEKDEIALNGGISCEGFGLYSGSSNLNINSNEKVGYAGSNVFKNVNIGGQFTFCGSLAIENSLNLNSGGVFMMNGAMVFGQFNKNRTLTINSNATMKVFGDLVIYGNLNLNSGATLEFVGEGNKVTIFGNVQKGQNVIIKGNFTDTEGKLK
ncbi:hypothetical protein SAMN00777080_0335 [Aquiflexum balticum DSM 16537]|uniref:LVIVD repeat-containing protein n=1 Tax=Aquiflexum balticum DSM 16537 TaxID=758820 RepID=A0A1W2GZ24_9BACT|nr:hypothetical protein [Aquiflexum balticum]SMD41804.1 hypothetical protein SAMN00777080_0335 [Aquiflexum balticum DSM 16537]